MGETLHRAICPSLQLYMVGTIRMDCKENTPMFRSQPFSLSSRSHFSDFLKIFMAFPDLLPRWFLSSKTKADDSVPTRRTPSCLSHRPTTPYSTHVPHRTTPRRCFLVSNTRADHFFLTHKLLLTPRLDLLIYSKQLNFILQVYKTFFVRIHD